MILEPGNDKIASGHTNDIWSLGVVKVESLGDKSQRYRWNFKNGNRLDNLR